jgi:hypothetical protein
MRFDELEHGHRIGAIAHQIAQKRKALRAECLCVVEARIERLEVRVNVGEERELQRTCLS